MLNKYLKNIGLKGRRLISLPTAPTYLGPGLVLTLVLRISYTSVVKLPARDNL
jgi:hypothetical protein